MASAAAPALAPMAAVSHVIFDMDGLLLDFPRGVVLMAPRACCCRHGGFYTEVQEKILARYGKVFDWSLKAKMMGKKATESARIFVDECGLAGLLTPEQFLEERESMLQELFPSCAVMPGVLRLVHHLHAKRVPMAVATGSHKRHFGLKTQNHRKCYTDCIMLSWEMNPDVKTGKPSPDIVLAAMRSLRYAVRVPRSKVGCFISQRS
ncbi:hypothetical protein GUJ93_ZPchr0008g12855 [Zizania palustris]|uniref:Uncharacterized protein n=1 Tax=Zizania palustris TaxID=103762 RepID=A0A8J5R5T3_ZIZPA|nr:hypothetical protein GUJ93_ZPchr0008g12855 [Zizania palustris]